MRRSLPKVCSNSDQEHPMLAWYSSRSVRPVAESRVEGGSGLEGQAEHHFEDGMSVTMLLMRRRNGKVLLTKASQAVTSRTRRRSSVRQAPLCK
jgi:hypothetical protein